MDLTSLILIIVAAAIAYTFVKFVLSPMIKAILGIIFFLIALYVLQNYFNLDLYKFFAPIFPYFKKFGINLDWIISIINSLWANIHKIVNIK